MNKTVHTYAAPPDLSYAVATTVSTTTITDAQWMTDPLEPFPSPNSEQDLENEAFNTPLEALRNMWLAKFSNRWVLQTDLDNEERFFYLSVYRLQQATMLEFVEMNGKRMFRVPPE